MINTDMKPQLPSIHNYKLTEETDGVTRIECLEWSRIDLEAFLDEECLNPVQIPGGFYVEAGFDEVCEVFEGLEGKFLTEASAVRKMVVRGGKRMVIFKCAPGQKKVKRQCVRRPGAELAKMKRRAKMSARKSKGKRSSANRKRKISMKRRRGIPTKRK